MTKKLAKWLAAKGYVADTTDAQAHARVAAKELAAIQDVLMMLDEYIDWKFPDEFEDEIQDHFYIRRIRLESCGWNRSFLDARPQSTHSDLVGLMFLWGNWLASFCLRSANSLCSARFVHS